MNLLDSQMSPGQRQKRIRLKALISRDRSQLPAKDLHPYTPLNEASTYTWNQVFLEIDRLGRTGELCVVHKRVGEYAVAFRVRPDSLRRKRAGLLLRIPASATVDADVL